MTEKYGWRVQKWGTVEEREEAKRMLDARFMPPGISWEHTQ